MSTTYAWTLSLAAITLLTACSKDPESAKREYMKSGDAYVARQQYREAIVEYRNAVGQDAQFGEARRKLAQAYSHVGDNANAFRESVRAADLLPDDTDAQLTAGDYLLAAHQFEDAKARADRVLEKSPNDVRGILLRANALAGLKKLDDAVADVERAISVDPNAGGSYASLGNMQLLRGNQAEAEAAYKKAVSVEPKLPEPRLALANFYWTSRRVEEAEIALKQAIELSPQHLLANRMLAAFLMATGRLGQAESPLKTVADRDEGSAGELTLAEYYVATNRVADARRVLESVVRSDRQSAATAKTRLAALDVLSGDTKQAAARISEVLADRHGDPAALAVKADLLAKEGKSEEAIAALRSAAEADPRSAPIQFALGRMYNAHHDPDAALGAFNAALKNDPRFVSAEVEASKLHLAAGRADVAYEMASSAAKKAPTYWDAQLVLARIHLLRNKPADAAALLKRVQDAAPPSAGVQTELGLVELARNNRVAARAAFERALAIDPSYANAVNALVRLDVAEKRPDAARARAQAAANADPTNGNLAVLVGSTYVATGDQANGERILREAIDRDANNFPAYVALARLYQSQRRLDQATIQFQALAARQPKNIGVHTTVGLLLEAQNRKAEAKAKYEEVMQLDPHAAVAANNLAWIYAEESAQLDIALQLAQTAKAQLPNRAEVNDTLGWIYHLKGMDKLAVGPLTEAVGQDPANPQIQYHLGVVHVATGNKAKAREVLTRALKLSQTFAEAAEARRLLESL